MTETSNTKQGVDPHFAELLPTKREIIVDGVRTTG